MADTTTSTAGSSGSSGGFAGTLKAKWGPLPVWGWLGIVTIALLGWYLWQQHQAGAAGTPAQQPTPSDVGQPGVVVINQDGPEGQTPPPTAPPPEPKHKGGGPSPEQPHKVTRQEAQALLKEKHTVYTRNRGGTYVPVTKLSGVHDQLYVGERAWDIWTKAHPKAKG